MNAPIIEKFRAGTDDDAPLFFGQPILLATTTGHATGRRHTTPLVAAAEGDRLFVIASKGGAPAHPTWYRNMCANPMVTVEHNGETFESTAAQADEATRDRIYAATAARFSNFTEYEEATDRRIPVMELVRTS
jgi:deazaflavin-dependent oxidoreductase (nitroreductase family)